MIRLAAPARAGIQAPEGQELSVLNRAAPNARLGEVEGLLPGLEEVADRTTAPPFPPTRYQGSKRHNARRIVESVRSLDFTSVLDAFGGTGAVGHAFKCAGKAVTYNDALAFNQQIGLALIENDSTRLDVETAGQLGNPRPGIEYGDFIQRTFGDIYFTDEENRWLDLAVGNLQAEPDRYRRALGYFAVFQAAIAKRPYNLFHRRNLYMRTAEVRRSFGNKASWDRSFADHVRQFSTDASAAVVDSGVRCRALCGDVLELEPEYDLVYLDPPYISAKGVGLDYRDFYHFLEGMTRHDEWPELIDLSSKHRRLKRTPDPWSSPQTCTEQFNRVLEHFERSILVVSYRSDGIPTPEELSDMLKRVKSRVEVVDDRRRQYALSTRRRTRELLFVAT